MIAVNHNVKRIVFGKSDIVVYRKFLAVSHIREISEIFLLRSGVVSFVSGCGYNLNSVPCKICGYVRHGNIRGCENFNL